METVKYCKTCGNQLLAEQNFCASCGTPSEAPGETEGLTAEPSASETPPFEQPELVAKTPHMPVPDAPRRKKKRVWPILLVGGFLVAAGVIAVMYLLPYLNLSKEVFEAGPAPVETPALPIAEEEPPPREDRKLEESPAPEEPEVVAEVEVPIEEEEVISEEVWKDSLIDFLSRRTGLFEDYNVMLAKYYSDYKRELLYTPDGYTVDFAFELCDINADGVPELLLLSGIPQTDAMMWTLYKMDGTQYKEIDSWSEYPAFYRDSEGRTVVIAGPGETTDAFDASYVDFSDGSYKKEIILNKNGHCLETGKTYDIYDWSSYGPSGPEWLRRFTADYGLTPVPVSDNESVKEAALSKADIKYGWREEYARFLGERYGKEFFLYDLDEDGVPELFHSADGYVWKVYEYKNEALSEIPAEDDYLYFGNATSEYDNVAEGLRGLMCQNSSSDGSYYYIYYLDGGTLKSMQILDIPTPRGEEPPEFVWCAIDHFQDGRQIQGARPHLAEFEGDNLNGVNIPFDDGWELANDLQRGEILRGYGMETDYNYYNFGNRLYAPDRYE